MLFIATNDFGHAKMGYKLNLIEGFGTKQSPYKPKNPENFRAGRFSKNTDGWILQSRNIFLRFKTLS